MRVEGNSSDLAACSHVTSPKAREPLEIGRASEHITGKGWQSANIHRNPWVWAFASHVLLKAQWLSRQQLERFTRKGAANLWEEDEERLLTRALREAEAGGCVPPCTVLDIGAAYGYYSILARLVAPSLRVHAFNPHPIFVKNMRENLLLNHLEGSVCLHDAAVGATNGHAQLAYSVHGRIQNGTAARQRRMTRVRVVTLDTWARQWLHGQACSHWLGRHVRIGGEVLDGRSARMKSHPAHRFAPAYQNTSHVNTLHECVRESLCLYGGIEVCGQGGRLGRRAEQGHIYARVRDHSPDRVHKGAHPHHLRPTPLPYLLAVGTDAMARQDGCRGRGGQCAPPRALAAAACPVVGDRHPQR